MEPPLIRQSDSGDGNVKIYTILGLAFLIWIVALGITCIWCRGYRRRRRSADENANVTDGEHHNPSQDTQNGHHTPRRRSSTQGPVPPPPIYMPELHAPQNSVPGHPPLEHAKNFYLPSGPQMIPIPYSTASFTGGTANHHVVQVEPDEPYVPRSVKERITSCSICLRGLKSKTVRGFDCGHVMHSTCLKQWSLASEQTECPVCLTLFGSKLVPKTGIHMKRNSTWVQ